MASTAEIVLRIEGKNEASQVIKDVDRDVSGLGSTLGKVGTIAGGFLAAGAIQQGVGALTGFIGDSVAAVKESNLVNAQLDAVLKSTGATAGVTAAAVRDHAAAIEKMSLFEDEAVMKGQNLLLTFTNIGGETFPRATQAMVDMAQAMGTDASGAAIQLGKALNDPTQGLTALSRVGVSFTDEQKEQIKAMQEAGNVAGAQAIILGELEKEFGGSAAAASQAAGASEVYKDRMNALQEEIGTKMLPVNEALMKAKIALIDLLTSRVIPVIEELYARHWPAISAAIGSVVAFVQANWPIFSEVINFGYEYVRTRIEGMIQVITSIVGIIQGVIDFVTAVFHGDWAAAWEALKSIASNSIDLLVGYIRMQFGNIPEIILGLAGEAANAAAHFAQNIFNAIVDGLASLPGAMLNIGREAINDLWRGISEFDLGGAIRNFIQGAIPGTIRSLLGIGSPSRVMYGFGQNIVEGILNGIKNRLPGLAAGAAQIAGVVWNAASGAAGAVGSAVRSVAGAIGGVFGGGGGGGLPSQVTQWRDLVARYFPANQVENALRIINAESGGNQFIVSPINRNGTRDVGLFQINDVHGLTEAMRMNAEANVAFAASLFARSGWQPWSTAPMLGLYHGGTNFVPRTGPYLLERGEAVIPASQNIGGAGGVTVNINGPVYARDAQEAARVAGDIGWMTSSSLRRIGVAV